MSLTIEQGHTEMSLHSFDKDGELEVGVTSYAGAHTSISIIYLKKYEVEKIIKHLQEQIQIAFPERSGDRLASDAATI